MSTAQLAPPHPILGSVAGLRALVAEIAEAQPTYLTTAEKQAALVELARLEAQVAEVRLRVLAAADEVGEESGARDAAAWVAAATRADPEAVRRDVQLAKALERRPLVAAGMRAGAVSAAQARAITAGVDALPTTIGANVLRDAEATLVGHAADFRPRELGRLARRILDVVAPEVAEEELARRLEDEEREARERESLRYRDNPDGTSDIWWRCPTTIRKRLWAYLQAMTSPRKEGRRAPKDARPPRRRAYAAALATLLEQVDSSGLPAHGGDATTLLVTMTLGQLQAELARAGILTPDGVDDISAEQARRLACSAGIVPVVLGSRGEVLDLGRRSRLFSAAQRRAIRLRDQRCRAEGCDAPAAWCEVHHRQPWAQGGRTDLADGVSFCSHHHHRVHDHRYEATWLPSGDVRFHRRR